jgi:hypothetical protein
LPIVGNKSPNSLNHKNCKKEKERKPWKQLQLLDVGTFLKKMFFFVFLANFPFQNTTLWEASLARSREVWEASVACSLARSREKFGSIVFAK